MTIYIVLALVTTALALLVEPKPSTEYGNPIVTRQMMKNRIVLAAIFLALFLVSACRIAIGNDYWEYTSIFDLIAQDRYVSTEFGFNTIVRICQFFFTFEKNYIVIFALFALGTILIFMKALYDQSENFGWAFFLFMAFGYYLSGFNSVRYYFVLSVALYSVKFLLKKDYARFILCILLAAPIHMAVLFVLLAYPLALIRWKKWYIPIVGIFVASLLILPNVYRRLIFIFYPFYEDSIYDTGETSYTNIARCAAVLLFALIFYKNALKDNKKNMFYFNLNLEALIVYSCCSFIPVVSRIGFFLNIFQIFLIPNIIGSIPKKWLKITCTVLVILAGVAYYLLFLNSCKNEGMRIIPYMNWILN